MKKLQKIICYLLFSFIAMCCFAQSFEIENTTLVRYIGKETQVTIPENVEMIGTYAFEECKVKNVIIPDSVKVIEEGAFYNCKKLKSIILPSSLETIYPGTFYNCYSLKEIEIPNTVSEIGRHAFCNCKSLKTVSLSENLKRFQHEAFYNCRKLKNMSIPSSLEFVGGNAIPNNCKLISEQRKLDNLIISYINIIENTDSLNVNVMYPEIKGCSKLNDIIYKNINNNINELITLAEENSKVSTGHYEIISKSNVTTSDDIVSVFLDTYYYCGGAHGNQSLTTYNYNLKSKKLVSLDVLLGKSFEEISIICKKELKENLITSDIELPEESRNILNEMIEKGTDPISENFSLFTINNDSITVYFEPYQVAPYNYGVQKVEISAIKQ